MVQAHWFMEIYIAIYLLIIYYHTLSYVWCYYFSRQIPWRHLIDISVKQYYVTIVLYDVIIVAPWWQPILKILTGQYGILSQCAPLLKVMWPGIDQPALSIYIWHIIKCCVCCLSERSGLGGSSDHAASTHQHHPAECHRTQHHGVRRLGRVSYYILRGVQTGAPHSRGCADGYHILGGVQTRAPHSRGCADCRVSHYILWGVQTVC